MTDAPCVFAVALTLAAAVRPVTAQAPLAPLEQRIRAAALAARDDQIAYLQRVVDIPSATLDLDGVRRVGAVFRASLDSLGFVTRWVEMPAEMRRAGHLVAEHRGRPGAVRMLLIGHFDTVVEPDGPNFVRQDSMARGVGSADMKGGDVVMLYALRALQAAGALGDLNITVVFTGDEEATGSPLDTARAALIDAARHSDIALAFEGGNRSDVTVARRGASSWSVTATGRQAHSAGGSRRGPATARSTSSRGSSTRSASSWPASRTSRSTSPRSWAGPTSPTTPSRIAARPGASSTSCPNARSPTVTCA